MTADHPPRRKRIAWLRPDAAASGVEPLDETAPLIAELACDHQIEVIGVAGANDLVWRHARDPFDVFVHELAGTPAHAFVPPYAIHFPGVLLLRDFAAHQGPSIQASRTVVVGDEAVASSLREIYPQIQFATAPVTAPVTATSNPGSAPQARGTQHATIFGLLTGPIDVVAQAAIRAREMAAELDVLTGPPLEVLRQADVIVALTWPPQAGPPGEAVAAMAAGKPVIVYESLVTAGWPALDPQTWQPRGYPPSPAAAGLGGTSPIAVSIDPRDEEHSLMLAMRRLAAEPALRADLGAAARTWWAAHATPAHAITAWRRILDAPGLPPSPPFPGADGSEHVRATLAEFGVSVDFL